MSAGRVPLITPDDLKQTGGAPAKVDVRGLEAELRKNIQGEVRFDAGSRGMYAVDASNYRQVPIGVVIPQSIEDVIQTVAACHQFGAPVLSRGGGTSVAGQCCNVAIVIDWTKYLHNILELNISEKYARVQPGTICDQLRHAAEPYKLTWGPDPATHTHCTFGGMLGNNSCGAHAQMAGKAVENVESMDILLYDGFLKKWYALRNSKTFKSAAAPEMFMQGSRAYATATPASLSTIIQNSRAAFPGTTSIGCYRGTMAVSISPAPSSVAKVRASQF